MTELKAYWHLDGVYDTELKKDCVEAESLDGEYFVFDYEDEVYLKSEADKYIAELEKENAELKEVYRWRLASEETPTDKTEVPVILDNGWRTTDYYEEDKGRWHYHWYSVTYWLLIPKAP